MGVFYETIPETLVEWILRQKCFWVATAPLSGAGHVNVSPKGGEYFGLLDNKTFWYHDLTGSGSETLAHLHEPANGRITVMFMAFEGAPKIVRLWGHGRVLERGTEAFNTFVVDHKVDTLPGTRSIILVDIHQAGSSCGFSVPFYEFKDFRLTLNDHYAKKAAKYEKTGDVKESMDYYWAYKNSLSIDGMPAMKRGTSVREQQKVVPMRKMVGAAGAAAHVRTGPGFSALAIVVIALLSFFLGIVLAVTSMKRLEQVWTSY